MLIRIRPRRLAGLLLSTTLAAGCLTGCSFLSPFKNCEGTESRVKDLASLRILESRPPAATLPKDFKDVESGCIDDSGDAWLFAERTYAFPGTRAEVIQYYRTAAERDGWKLEQDSERPPVPEETAGLCFARGGDGQVMLLTLYFMTAHDLAIEGCKTGAEFASGSGFRIAAGSETDGAITGCWD
ncbi:hypothetical protein ACFVZH_33435 [Streptomyces sp. NPDC059534]|uniref:hypothetical protein n=1 Tax=Streptomyces sp. NPDC059534 TaxID=3346859 RepID=UPI0036857D09